MKRILVLAIILCVASEFVRAQQTSSSAHVEGRNFESTSCLSSTQREEILQKLELNKQELADHGKLISTNRNSIVLFDWPTQSAEVDPSFGNFCITGYVDNNPAYPNLLSDYNCGAATYDTQDGYNHAGTDIYTWPFAWYHMAQNEIEVIAAADGQIVGKDDGNSDQSCAWNSNGWNAVYVEHSDGSVAWYGHMKNGTPTSKNIGETVVAGEYLGVVGSSGNSSGPHLHFEIYDAGNNLIDPFYGACNNFNSSSWWNAQIPYVESKINHIGIGYTWPSPFPPCPTIESPNEQFAFQATDTIFLTPYFNYLKANDVAAFRIYDANMQLYFYWYMDNQWGAFQLAYISYWLIPGLGAPEGIWTAEVDYEGITYIENFQVGSLPTSAGNIFSENVISVFPNPSSGNIFLEIHSSKNQQTSIEMFNSLGEKVFAEEKNLVAGVNKIVLEQNLPDGIYFLKYSDAEKISTSQMSVLNQP